MVKAPPPPSFMMSRLLRPLTRLATRFSVGLPLRRPITSQPTLGETVTQEAANLFVNVEQEHACAATIGGHGSMLR